ncbi:MAG: polysaccharide biosynthesis C-terminal domain-containing protein [Oscillospiraceae bacterium]
MSEHSIHTKGGMSRTAAILSAFSVSLQLFGLLLNVFLTKRLGAASVGMITLMSSFYSLACVFTGGSGFIATSRFLSEELGAQGDTRKVFRYILRFCFSLSIPAAIVLLIFPTQIVHLISHEAIGATAIRLLGISLPVAAFYACCKGRCYAYQRVYLPAIAECIEFVLRAAILAFATEFLIPKGSISLLSAFALSMLVGQGSAALFLFFARVPYASGANTCTITFRHLLRQLLPILSNACLVSLLSSTNDALVPLTLLQYGNSTDEALSQFGEFEAIIIPALFFPSVVQCCMSGLLVPTLSKLQALGDEDGIRKTTQRVLEQTVGFSLFAVLIFALFGHTIGSFLGGDAFAGSVLCKMAPIIPFIYIEIILEGVLRGIGKQGFSSLNYLAEYTVRISVLLICVPLFGFYGIIASYLACNLVGNAVRMFFVFRTTGLHPSWKRILVRPAFTLLIAWQCTALLLFVFRGQQLGDTLYFALFTIICGLLDLFLLRILEQLPAAKKKAEIIPA